MSGFLETVLRLQSRHAADAQKMHSVSWSQFVPFAACRNQLSVLLVLTESQNACRGKPSSVWGPDVQPARTGSSLSRSLRGMPSRLLRDSNSPSEAHSAETGQTITTGIKGQKLHVADHKYYRYNKLTRRIVRTVRIYSWTQSRETL